MCQRNFLMVDSIRKQRYSKVGTMRGMRIFSTPEKTKTNRHKCVNVVWMTFT